MAAVPPAFTIDHQLAAFNKVPLEKQVEGKAQKGVGNVQDAAGDIADDSCKNH